MHTKRKENPKRKRALQNGRESFKRKEREDGLGMDIRSHYKSKKGCDRDRGRRKRHYADYFDIV